LNELCSLGVENFVFQIVRQTPVTTAEAATTAVTRTTTTVATTTAVATQEASTMTTFFYEVSLV
jgi:hypothetical protein